MRLHETWTGAANSGDRTFSVASVEGVSFTVSKNLKGGYEGNISTSCIKTCYILKLCCRHMLLVATLSYCHQASKGFKSSPVYVMITSKYHHLLQR